MQVLVVGAGVVGLAIARAAALAGHEVIVAEAADGIGTGVSSRNSEVIHAGLYYPTGSKRAYHCPRGRRMLYEFCASHGVPHRRCGKLVVATSEAEIGKLDAIHKQAQINGVEGVEMIDEAAARALEPELSCLVAMHSPETGVVDSHRYMLALRGDLEDHGGMIAFNTRDRAHRARAGWMAAVLRRRRDDRGRRRGQCRRARRADARTRHRRLPAGAGAAALSRQGQLFRLRRPAGVLAPDLSGADPRWARRARDARSRRAHAVRARCRVDRGGELRRRPAARAGVLRQHPRNISRGCRTARWCRTIPASAPSSPARTRRRSTS